MHIPGCQKNGTFHTGIQKNRAIHILFVEKRGPIIYLAALKKGAIRHAHQYYAIYRKLPPPPREHAYSNNNENFPTKNENFQIKNSDIFLISAQNIDCGYSYRLDEAVLTDTHNLCF